MDTTRELVVTGVTILYGVFLFHYLFPGAYHRLQAWLLRLLDWLIERWDALQWQAKWRHKMELPSEGGNDA